MADELGSIDLHLINEGRHEQLWRALGAHPDDAGTRFAVWAPNAMEVQVVGDFNGWDGSRNPLRLLGSSGIWQTHVPGVSSGAAYKFRVRGDDGEWRDKADPLAFRTGLPPETTSVVHTSSHTWTDDDWMAARAAVERPDQQPMSVYEVHLPSWRRDGDRSLSWDELAEQLTSYVVETGFTHVEFMPVMEHPFGGSWGYQVSSYFAPTARLGDPDGLKRLIDALHRAGVGVILDWVPAHFPKDEFALARFDGTPLYEDPNPTRGEHPEWGTYIFNFGRREVRNFLVANALFWLQEYHADGLRVDAVASMIYLDYAREDGQWQPNVRGGHENLEAVEFLQEMNATVYR
ncbi:MAG: 1,4-alpha-glucan branching enzyme, partial [Myxococcales bacterium]